MSAGWRSEAACAGKPTEWFFPPNHAGINGYKNGKETCAACPVRLECRRDHEAAERELDRVLPGLWGGEVRRGSARKQHA